MVDEINKLNNLNSTTTSSRTSSASSSASELTAKNQTVSQEQFLHLLVAQLKNQDPLDPDKPEEFASKLATFSQLESLKNIEKVLTEGSSDAGTLATYLGRSVILNQDQVNFDSGEGGILRIDLSREVSGGKVEILDAQGSVAETLNFGALGAGQHELKLSNTNIASGNYGFRVKATSTAGVEFDVPAKVAGKVTGYVPGDIPALVVNGQQVNPADILEVYVPEEA